MKDVIRLLLAFTIATLIFVAYQDFLVTDVGIFHKNDCGTYDRWFIWVNDPFEPSVPVVRFPNGVLGKDSKYCKEVK